VALEITWLGRTCFRLKGREGTVVSDPCPPSSGYRISNVEADVVTLSRADDPEFSYRDAVRGRAMALGAPGAYEVGGILATGIAVKRSDGTRNVVFVVELDGLRVAHLGVPTERIPDAVQNELEGVDILLLPVGGHGTLAPAVASDVMTAVDAHLVIPMLFKTSSETMDLEPIESFLKETGAKPEPQPRISVTRSSLPAELTVVVLEPRA
jgi:L-ascorbate metabolism protein UlaG (beta-lactamase superfamily)